MAACKETTGQVRCELPHGNGGRMRIVNQTRDKAARDLAELAGRHFTDHPGSYTYADGDPAPGELMAIRWNSYTVMVIQLNDEEPLLFPTANLGLPDLPRMGGMS